MCHRCTIPESHVSAAARINARQATSTRVAFSDDEEADDPKAKIWQPKGNLVTPAKPKVNPVPSANASRGPKGSTFWSDAVRVLVSDLCLRVLSFSSLQEVDLLVKAINEFGFGSWAKMKSKYKFSNPERSELQLKDKARNLVKTGKHSVSFEHPNFVFMYLSSSFYFLSSHPTARNPAATPLMTPRLSISKLYYRSMFQGLHLKRSLLPNMQKLNARHFRTRRVFILSPKCNLL